VPVNVELDDATQKIRIHAEYRYKDLVKTLPGSKWDQKANTWTVPRSWSGCLALRSTFGASLEIGPNLSDWAFNERKTRVDPANALRDAISSDVGDADLYPHQRAGVQFLATARRALLADEPGLGKTAQSIRSLKALHDAGEEVFPAIIVCPSTIKKNWEREFKMWWPDINVQVIDGTPVKRRKQFKNILEPVDGEPTPDVVVINWDSLRLHSRLAPYGSISIAKCKACGGSDANVTEAKCQAHKRELNMIDFKSAVADEIHRAKDPKSQQTRALWAATAGAEIRFALTGTPMAADVTDLWPILHWLDPDEWPSKSRWIDRFVDTMTNAFGGTIVLGIKPAMLDEFYASINPRMRRMLKSIVLDLPPIIYERRDVTMGAKQKKAYEQMRDHMIAEVEGDQFLTASSALTQMTRLLQFASASATLEADPRTGEIKAKLSEPSATLDAVMDDIKSGDFGPDSVAITSVSRQLLELLSARLTKEGIEHGMVTGALTQDQRNAHIDDFQAGRTKFILYTAGAGGVGVTLTAARWLLRIQRPWSLIDDVQVRDRVHRIGSEIHDSIIIQDYVTSDTVQDHVAEVLGVKGDSFEQIVRDKDQIVKILMREKKK
jgi:SNF2 family DNA or RNA helicase